jgi:hypothetical protein
MTESGQAITSGYKPQPQEQQSKRGSILRISGQLFRVLTPTLTEQRVDSKKDMETELRRACEVLIQEQIQSIALPLVEFNAKISEVMDAGSAQAYGSKKGSPANAKRISAEVLAKTIQNEVFMQNEGLAKLDEQFRTNVRTLIPVLCAKMRLYLTHRANRGTDYELDPGAEDVNDDEMSNSRLTKAKLDSATGGRNNANVNAASGSEATGGETTDDLANASSLSYNSSKKSSDTFYILFRPIHSSLVESVAQLWSLLKEFQIEHSFISEKELDQKISAIVTIIDKMQYKDLVRVVEGVGYE